MAKVLIFNICLVLLLLSRVESCVIPDFLHVEVPQIIPAGHTITKVEDASCNPTSMNLTSMDPSFTVNSNGEIEATAMVSVPAEGRTFSVLGHDNTGKKKATVHLFPWTRQERKDKHEVFLRRSKRRWSPPPFNIIENDVGPYPKDIERIVSDSSGKYPVYYTCSGPGYDENPVGVFTLNRDTGMLTVHRAVDREMFPSFTLVVEVFNKYTNEPTDLPLPIKIIVDDKNDNNPTFTDPLQFTVPEFSPVGTVVGKVNATDRDLEGSLHVKIRYSLLTGLNLFAINSETGVITTKTNTLDREVQDKQLVTVQIQDMDGAANGLSNTGTATITLSDINDNPPTFTKNSYQTNVMENESEKLVLRIPVEDKDLINTPNWISEFIITKGNENGNFRIDTDPKTNEGLLYVTKALDHEKNKNVNLEIMARNEAELTGTNAKWLSIPVNVAVGNIDEGPQFTAPTLRLNVKENTPNGTLIGTYTAVDPETQSSDGIKYYEVSDPASWIDVDRNTGELKVVNTIDRESHYVQNGIYNVTVKAVDASTKTSTGTVIIVVEDVNDNAPTIPSSEMVMCERDGVLSSLLVVAEDNDMSPFSAPFSFSLPDSQKDTWSVTKFNDTAVTLQQLKALPKRIYEVPMDVTDLQGFSKKQTAKVRLCKCSNGVCLAKKTAISLGPLGILTLLLPLALLLLLGLLLAFFCATKREKMELEDVGDSGGILLKSNTEAPGEEVDSSLITVPTTFVEPVVKGSVKGLNAGWMGNNSSSTFGAHTTHDNGMYKSGVVTNDMQDFYGQYDSQYGAQQLNGGGQFVGSSMTFDNRQLVQDSALHHTWQTNGRYLHQKLAYLGTEEDGRYADDIVHPYGFEGVGSVAGSVGCCSDYGETENLDFLNTLGPKFKTLAETCTNR